MEQTLQFFNAILPDDGFLVVFSLKAFKTPETRFFISYEQAIAYAEDKVKNKHDVYFGCAKYESQYFGKTSQNAKYFKSFWLDIDCGENKFYAFEADALTDLSKLGLPKPTLVNSGYGLHAYWTLDQVLDYNTWKPIAECFKQYTANIQFHADPQRTSDAASVLRVPGTLNFKKVEPRPVTLRSFGESITLDAFKTIIQFADWRSEIVSLNEVSKAAIGNITYSFSKILKKCYEHDCVVKTVEENTTDKNNCSYVKIEKKKVLQLRGCAQIKYCYEQQNDIPEPLWRSALSIAQFCADKDTAIHLISNKHDEYDPRLTEDKANKIVAPHKCSTFQSFNPELCLECPHRGKINTPIVLGKDIIAAEPSDNILQSIWHTNLKTYKDIEIPILPYPWFRGKLGGIYVKSDIDNKDSESQDDGILVYINDLWVKQRIRDVNYGETLIINHILPKDGLIEFILPMAHLMSKDKFREILASNGVAVLDKQMDLIRAYINKWCVILQIRSSADLSRLQFGWHDEDTRFTLGTRELTNQGEIIYVAPSSHTLEAAPIYTSAGTLEAWKCAIQSYDLPGNEVRAFGLFMSFGAPLYKFLGVGSMIVHLTNVMSGVGKSTIQMVAASVWGHPYKSLLTNSDTINAKEFRFGILNNIIICIDEITNIKPEDASDIVFRFSGGRGKHRLRSQVNIERHNAANWSTMALTSGNNSLRDILSTNRLCAEGELFRVLELDVNLDKSLTKKESDYRFNKLLFENYGLAGEIYMKHVVQNLPSVQERLREMQKHMDTSANLTAKDRFFSACFASAFTGAAIAKELGLHSFDVDRVMQWAVKIILNKQKAKQQTSYTHIIGDFINTNIDNMLVVNMALLNGVVVKEPRNKLMMRYEQDKKELYISKDSFTNWCVQRRQPVQPILNKLKNSKYLVAEKNYRLGQGMAQASAETKCLLFDADKLDIELLTNDNTEAS